MKSDPKKLRVKREQEGLNILPSFLDKIILLLGSGQTFKKALNTAISSLESKGRPTDFEKEIIEIKSGCMASGEGLVNGFIRFSTGSGIKEYIRLGNIIEESKQSGGDLRERLSNESKELWVQRKNRFQEAVRVNETKLSFPLSLLLMAVIIITAAPALMQL